MKREELIAYDKWLTENKWGSCEIVTPEQAADLYLAEHPLPPAEGAEKVQRCPVCMGRGLVPNSFYATTSGIGSTTQTYLPEKCRTCNGAGVIIPPYPKLQPTAEGAEAYLRKHPFLLGETEDGEDYLSTEDIEFIKQLAPMLEEFAAIHAQRLAEKMVEERLRNELMAYDSWLMSHDMGFDFDSTEQCVDEYLKSRDSK